MKRTLALVLAVLLALSTIALAESTELELQTIVLSKEKDNGEITLAVGEQRQIDPAFATANGWTVTGYKSSKAKAVTVDGNGLVTACAEGKAKITVKTDNKKKAKIKVKVIDPYKPDNIAIAQGKEITLAVGQSVRLDAVLSPVTAQTTLEWKSSKGKYVTVDGSGVVYAAAEGSAKITVKTHNKKKASIKVKVVDPYKPNGVSIPQGKEATLTVGQTLQLGAALSPSTAQATLVWTSSKPGVATVDGGGLVTAVDKGSAKITVKTHNGKKATCKVKVDEEGNTVYVATSYDDNLAVRSSPDKTANILTTIRRGYTGKLLSKKTINGWEWYYVDYNGTKGWVLSNGADLWNKDGSDASGRSHGYTIVIAANNKVLLRLGPDLSEESWYTIYKNEALSFMQNTAVDSRGVIWYEVDCDGVYYWAPGTDVTLS